MWVLGIILGVIIVVCLIFGWYSMDNYAPKKRVLILLLTVPDSIL